MQIFVKTGRTRHIGMPGLLAALCLAAAGCAHTRLGDPAREPVQRLLPRFAEMMAGPAADLLTNVDGFHGEFTANFGSGDETGRTVSGRLSERGSKLCFEPAFQPSKRKGYEPGQFSIIWDTVEKRGYVLSDALQGAAPLAADTSAGTSTNALKFRVERADNLNGLATRIESRDPTQPFIFTLSGVKLGLPPVEKFAPPADFTHYQSVDALLSELATRQRMVMGTGGKGEGEGDLGDYNTQPGMRHPQAGGGMGY